MNECWILFVLMWNKWTTSVSVESWFVMTSVTECNDIVNAFNFIVLKYTIACTHTDTFKFNRYSGSTFRREFCSFVHLSCVTFILSTNVVCKRYAMTVRLPDRFVFFCSPFFVQYNQCTIEKPSNKQTKKTVALDNTNILCSKKK